MAGILTQIQRQWYIARITGDVVGPQTPLEQLQRVYYSQFLGGNQSGKTLPDLEIQFLVKYLNAHGGSSQSTKRKDLWISAVAAIGKTPSKFLNDNMMKFFLNAP